MIASAHPRLDVLLVGRRFSTSCGAPAFCSVVLVQGKDRAGVDRRVLVDTGHIGTLPPLLEALGDRGVDPSEIDTVVCTHAHWDHIASIGAFQNAAIVMHPAEREYIRAPDPRDFPSPRWVTLVVDDLEDRVMLADDGHEILPGVQALATPGHSAGSLSVVVEEADQTTVVVGDAVQNLYVARTGVNDLVFWDNDQATRSIRRVVEIADRIVPGHDDVLRCRNGELAYESPAPIGVSGLDPEDPGVTFSPGIERPQRLVAEIRRDRR